MNVNLARADCKNLPIPDSSVDLIFTDPPYLREYLPCYEWLANESMRVLKPGGFVLAMCGGSYLNKIYRMFDDAGLDYFWEFVFRINGGNASLIWPKGVIALTKSILAYSKGVSKPRSQVMGVWDSERSDKKYHAWGQPVESARYFIDCFSLPGEIVLDPFVGGGTTLVACNLIGRRGIGFDIDPVALATCHSRLTNSDILHTLPMFASG